MSDFLTVDEAAVQLRMSPRFVYDELRRKNLRGSKYGGQWVVATSDLRAYVEAHANVRPVKK